MKNNSWENKIKDKMHEQHFVYDNSQWLSLEKELKKKKHKSWFYKFGLILLLVLSTLGVVGAIMGPSVYSFITSSKNTSSNLESAKTRSRPEEQSNENEKSNTTDGDQPEQIQTNPDKVITGIKEPSNTKVLVLKQGFQKSSKTIKSKDRIKLKKEPQNVDVSAQKSDFDKAPGSASAKLQKKLDHSEPNSAVKTNESDEVKKEAELKKDSSAQENNKTVSKDPKSEIDSSLILANMDYTGNSNTITDTAQADSVSNSKNKTKGGKSDLFNDKLRLKPHVLAGLDMTWTSPFTVYRPGYKLGVGAEVLLGRKGAINTGLIYHRKIYKNKNTDFYNPSKSYSFWSGNVVPVETIGKMDIIEIPLQYNFYFTNSQKSSWYAGVGFNSYLVLKEQFNFSYDKSPQNGGPNVIIPGQTKHREQWETKANLYNWLTITNINIGYQKALGDNRFVQISSYVDLPIEYLGAGFVNAKSVGVNIKYCFLQ